ncbi:MAG: sialic acid TRAP transporter substrate-binding protein SiaP [Nitrospirota bacterium]|nr:MAG: sialic acid TRAP transporter substrate-binding protein SiaP [Nitrospirota bacterium]
MISAFKYITAVILLIIGLVPDAECSEKVYELKFNTVAGPQQPQVKALNVFAEEVKRISEGKVKVQVFHSGQLGNQQTQITGIMRGTIDMTFTTPNFMSRFDRKIGIFGAAYLFRDLEHMYSVMNGPIGIEYFNGIANSMGVRPLDVWYLGSRHLNLRDKAVSTPDDMKGVKLRMPNSPLWIAMGRALGANPTPLGFGEVYMALKTGVVDGQDNPLPTNEAQKFYEVTKYMVLTGHQMGMLWPSINERLWNEMPDQYRGWILQALKVAREYQNDIVLRGETELLRKFKDEYGMIIIEPDVDAFRKRAGYAYKEFEKDWGEGTYERIQNYKD